MKDHNCQYPPGLARPHRAGRRDRARPAWSEADTSYQTWRITEKALINQFMPLYGTSSQIHPA
jgi:hypothetical protein